MDTIDLIARIASVPSFSSYEERLHPVIREILSPIDGLIMTVVPRNNFLIEVPGREDCSPIAITAHLDKINHFGHDMEESLPIERLSDRLRGQLDDAAGVGICLKMALKSRSGRFPPLWLLLSEMEESTGLKEHPHLLRNNGEGLSSSMGAESLARYCLAEGKIPAAVLTIDTTPHFRGKPGVAIYCAHWEKNGLTPTPALTAATEALRLQLQSYHPALEVLNNVNDYVAYGLAFNSSGTLCVPSVALEPAIFPYHKRDEEVFFSDIQAIENILTSFLASVSV